MDVNIHMTVGDCPQTFGVNLGTKYVKEKNNLMTNMMLFDEHYANTLTNTKLSPKNNTWKLNKPVCNHISIMTPNLL